MILGRVICAVLFAVFFFSGCSADAPSERLPGGYKIWVMNAQEIYLSDKDDELLVGPALRTIGTTTSYIVAFCEPAPSGYQGNLRSSGYSLIKVKSGVVRTGLQLHDVERELNAAGEVMPKMLSYDRYRAVPN
jgi:hypothetical protein